jgi:uncharacterized delta-60 repeat protein
MKTKPTALRRILQSGVTAVQSGRKTASIKLAALIAISFVFTCPFAHAAPADFDPTFGTSGIVTTDFGNSGDEPKAIAVQSDGKIVVAGTTYFFASGNVSDFALVRYNTDGTLDTTFNGTGKVTTDFGGEDHAKSVLVQADGKIVVAGDSFDGIFSNFVLARYNPNGTLDTTFNGSGKVRTQLVGGEEGESVALQADGKIVLAGHSANGLSNQCIALVRYNIDGTMDMSFNGTGAVTASFDGAADRLFSVAVQSDGKIVAAGNQINAGSSFLIVRYNPNGTMDTSFNGTGKVITGFAGDNSGGSTSLALGKC